MITVPITAPTTSEALKDVKEACKLADVIELRLDYMKKPDLKRLLVKKQVIVTVRKKKEGGKLSIPDSKRMELLENAVDLKADYVDVELSTNKSLIKKLMKNKKKTKIIPKSNNCLNEIIYYKLVTSLYK